VTNTVALVFSSVGSVSGSRPELAGQREKARHLAPLAVAGGLSGGLLLLATPAGAFARLVPWLIGVASFAVVAPRRALGRPFRAAAVAAASAERISGPPAMPAAPATSSAPGGARTGAVLSAGVFLVALYGGYFGAAAGVVLLAMLLMSTTEPLPRCAALRNLLLGLANGVAAVSFALFGPVRWEAALPLAVGFLVGGRIGPVIVRKVPSGPLRLLIACAGVGLAVHLGLDAYH
jgi:uncharacterized membrane protein YfcA